MAEPTAEDTTPAEAWVEAPDHAPYIAEATGIPLYEETEIRAVFEKLKWHNVDLFLSVLRGAQ